MTLDFGGGVGGLNQYFAFRIERKRRWVRGMEENRGVKSYRIWRSMREKSDERKFA